MKTKHTPGPCPQCKEGRRLNELIFLCACGPKPDGSWTKHTYLASQYPTYAAAPELLEACRKAYEIICPIEFPGRASPKAQEMLCALRDALIKAEGREG